jgi:serpin B
MLAEGAKGATASELARVLQEADALDLDGLRALRADLAHRLRAASNDIGWNEANGLWVDDSATLVPETQSALETYHGASIRPADFRTDFDGVRGNINRWVKKETGGRIEDLLPAGSVSSMTRLVLVNAVQFLGKWEDEFEAKSTGDLPFLLADGTETSVPFLKDWRSMAIGFFDAEDKMAHAPKDVALTAFELPYLGGRLSFVGLIPASPTGLPELERRVSAPLLKQWRSALHTQRTDFAMPKLKLEPSYDLVPILQGLGLGSMLDPGTADLGGFFEGNAKGLHVTGAYHSAFLKIDEEGTEAAAATGVVAGITSAAGPPPKVHADRPYLFLITERATGAILFMGRVANP